MALYDVVQFEGTGADWLIYKFPRNDFNTRMSLIVGPGQIAICVHDGKIEKICEEGKFVLDTELLPFVKGLVKAIHGGNNPYPMEVYFINKRLKLDLLWGTSDSVKIVDPEYHVQINVRARGQLGVRLKDYQYFLQTLVGTLMKDSSINFDVIRDYFRGLINQKAKKTISSLMLGEKISIFNVEPHIEEIANAIKGELEPEMAKFGFEIVNLSVESINVPQEDTDALNAIFHKKAEFEQLGDTRYRTARGYDVLEGAAITKAVESLRWVSALRLACPWAAKWPIPLTAETVASSLRPRRKSKPRPLNARIVTDKSSLEPNSAPSAAIKWSTSARNAAPL